MIKKPKAILNLHSKLFNNPNYSAKIMIKKPKGILKPKSIVNHKVKMINKRFLKRTAKLYKNFKQFLNPNLVYI